MTRCVALLLCIVLLCGCSAGGGRFVNPTPPAPSEPTLAPVTVPPTEPSADAGSTGATVPETQPPQPTVPATAGSDLAEIYVDTLTLREQAAQMFLIVCPESDVSDIISRYQPGGLLLFKTDTARHTVESFQSTLSGYQDAAKTPLIIAVDEEGGTVNRVSCHAAFRSTQFPSPRRTYWQDGPEAMLAIETEKAQLLRSLGINVNLAPVCDVVTDPNAFMAERSFQMNAEQTGALIAQIVDVMNTERVGACLKHFPGYGDNGDTHNGTVVDERPVQSFRDSDFIPFKKGIEAGAGAVLVCHNIVTSMDPSLPASLSPIVHKLLREELCFEGVVITDDLMMDAITMAYGPEEAAVLAVLAGNDMLITHWSEAQLDAIVDAVKLGRIPESRIRESAIRVIQWKIDLGLF